MTKFEPALTPSWREFITAQHMFFTATAPLSGEGRINLSPKGIDTFRVLSESEVAYLDLTGSGNETAAHTLENGRLTIMFCSFDQKPLILRLYGRGEAIRPGDREWDALLRHFDHLPGTRQIIRLKIDSVQASCGWGVPRYDYRGERETLVEWGRTKGEEAVRDYHQQKNTQSIDGLPTGIGSA